MNCEDDSIPGLGANEGKIKPCAGEIASTEEVGAALTSLINNDKNFLKRLSWFTLGYIRLYFSRDCAGKLTSDDAVQNVLEKIIKCKRKWNKNRFPSILDFIRLSIISFVRNEKKRKEKIEPVDIYGEDGELEEWKHKDYIRACIEKDLSTGLLDAGKYEKLCERLFMELKNDKVATGVLEQRLEGIKSNIKIAGILGVNVREVETALKRIKRKYCRLAESLRE